MPACPLVDTSSGCSRLLPLCRGMLLVLLALLGAMACAEPAALWVTYPRQENGDDVRGSYPLQLLALALDKGGVQARLRPAALAMQQGRAVRELAKNSGLISVLWTMTSREREQLLLPIRIPIDKGLYGWRISLVRADRFDIFQGVDSVAGLRHFVAGQGHDWPDVAVLRGAGLNVEVTNSYESLFSMLSANRFDYFPRSIIEIWPEAEKHRELGLIVEPLVVLHYPTALYFFVNKRDTQLASHIQRGLELAVKDGSFDRLFYRYFAEEIERARLAARQVIALDNPDLPSLTPLDRTEFWFHPADMTSAPPR